MTYKSKLTYHSSIFIVIIVLLTFLYKLSNNDVYFYISVLLILISTLKRNKFKIKVLFLPIPSFILYYTINIIVGYYAYDNELIYKAYDAKYLGAKYSPEYNIFIMIVLIIFYFFDIYFHKGEKLLFSVSDELKNKFNYKRSNYIYVVLLIFFFNFISNDLSTYFNTQGGVFSIPVTFFSILLLYRLSNKISLIKYLLVLIGLLALFSIFNYDSKREVILILFAGILFLLKDTKISFIKTSVLVVISFFTFLHIIISLSILRGWLGFETNSLKNAIIYSFDYIYNPSNLLFVLHNFEAPAIYNHGLHAYFYLKFNIISPNLAILESLFWFVPNFIAELRPQSIIDRFTSTHNPLIREGGNSLVSGVITEFTWSFGLVGGIIMLISFYFLMQKFILKNKFSPLVIYGFLLLHISMYLRGSGLVLFIQYFFVYYLCYRISKTLKL